MDSFIELALVPLRCLFIFSFVLILVELPSFLLVMYVYLKGEMTTQIRADTPLGKDNVCWRVTTKGEEHLVLHFVTCPPSTCAKHCFFLGAVSPCTYPVGTWWWKATQSFCTRQLVYSSSLTWGQWCPDELPPVAGAWLELRFSVHSHEPSRAEEALSQPVKGEERKV